MTADARTRAIPRHVHPPSALEYANVPVDTSDARSREPLVDIADYGVAGQCYYARNDGENGPYYRAFAAAHANVRCRRSVAEKLARVNEALAPYEVELFVLDGYRSLKLQADLWSFFIEQAKATLPSPTEVECIAFAGEYCSDPDEFDPSDSRTWPTHITGGAIDTTLRLIGTGDHLFMGSIFDDPSDLSHTQHFEVELEKAQRDGRQLDLSDLDALRNRRLLYWSMIEAGFTNYPYEWWHFDWGTQMWVENSGNFATSAEAPVRAWYGAASG